MATVEARGAGAPAWHGGFGRLWSAAAFFVLSVTVLIPALKPDVSVVEPADGGTTAHVKP
ncbi:hypothetical protein [Streptomyces albicerus]|uniref:hypothetical protein n=1 Tax=Streptomyces albicerus TaxID=2569859 RepID=UPI00124B95D6|nr:hypothetical protein [Streptomyces albicerus]